MVRYGKVWYGMVWYGEVVHSGGGACEEGYVFYKYLGFWTSGEETYPTPIRLDCMGGGNQSLQ